MKVISYYPYKPALQGIFAERFYERARELSESGLSMNQSYRYIQEEADWASYRILINPAQRRIYRAVWLLLRDLIRIGWTYRWREGCFEIAPPFTDSGAASIEELIEMKNSIREAMAPSRIDKLVEAKAFIDRMENPSAKIGKLPITELIADGKALSYKLEKARGIKDRTSRAEKLKGIIKPYMQLVVESERCEFSNHKLSDIWRYFRLTWATPAENTPGRTMLYLIRDAAQENHPIMGIASLENSPIKMELRDVFLGWTPEAFTEEVEECENIESVRECFSGLLTDIDNALGDLDYSEFCSEKQCINPSDALMRELAEISSSSAIERKAALKKWYSRDELDEDLEIIEKSRLGNISKEAEIHLYRRKRAERLLRLLKARRRIRDFIDSNHFEANINEFLHSETGRTAIGTALMAQKNRHIGTSILELNVCGAIPPYNEILSGKLVALMMLSTQVLFDYRERYGDRASDIASRMKGEDVVRPAEIVYLGTTSLYQVGSSQYNRLKLPAGFASSNAPEIKWKRLKHEPLETTSGFGTFHISRLTLQCIEEANDPLHIHHVFGEGASPKLRALSKGLVPLFELGQRQIVDQITRHSMGRLVYGVILASNIKSYFRGKDQHPDYYFDLNEPPNSVTERIVEYWRTRWLTNRIDNQDVIDRVNAFSRTSLLVSRSLPVTEGMNFYPIKEANMDKDENGGNEEWFDYVLKLYRGQSAYSDSIDLRTLKRLHINTKLDEAIMNAIKAGKSVILTGNPGDGKTHILRVLQGRLEKMKIAPLVILDASAINDGEMLKVWGKALKEGRPVCAAINESVLFTLASKGKARSQLLQAVEQVKTAIIYDEALDSSEEKDVVVFDLSHRDVLTREIIDAAIDNLTNPDNYRRCNNCSENRECDFVRNMGLLKEGRVRERLFMLLSRVSHHGSHTTLRELQSLISFLLLGSRDCSELIKSSGDTEYALPQLLFCGEGRIFESLRALDPAKISHPKWDEMLLAAETNPEDWVEGWGFERESLDPTNTNRFRSRKRAFFLFHKNGNELLDILEDDIELFERFLESTDDRATLRNVISMINRTFGLDNVADRLLVWQSHRFNHAPRRVIYSSTNYEKYMLEIVRPRLVESMSKAYDLALDHLLMRLKNKRSVNIRIDFELFKSLSQAEKGVPILHLESNMIRQLWHFMEQLVYSFSKTLQDEADIRILDTMDKETLIVKVDIKDGKYLNITS